MNKTESYSGSNEGLEEASTPNADKLNLSEQKIPDLATEIFKRIDSLANEPNFDARTCLRYLIYELSYSHRASGQRRSQINVPATRNADPVSKVAGEIYDMIVRPQSGIRKDAVFTAEEKEKIRQLVDELVMIRDEKKINNDVSSFISYIRTKAVAGSE